MGWEPLHSSCHWNHPECISRLLSAGADVNAPTAGGKYSYINSRLLKIINFVIFLDQTPLHIASSISHCKKMLQLLLLHPDVDPFIKNKSGDYPQDIAKRTGIYNYIFKMSDPAINYIKSKSFMENPFMTH